MLTPSDMALFPYLGSAQKGSRVPWYVAIIGCVYYAGLCLSLGRVVPVFAQLFVGIGVDLPLPTRILFSTHAWLFPFLFLGAVIVTLVKQIAVLKGSQRRIANRFLLFIGVIFPALVVFYLPLLVLIYRLHTAQ